MNIFEIPLRIIEWIFDLFDSGYSNEEIARATHVPIFSVNMILSRGLLSFRGKIGREKRKKKKK